MSPEVDVPVFAEDNAHEQFVRAMLKRLASETSITLNIDVVSARGGHGQAMTEFRAYQLALQNQRHLGGMLVVAIDANCRGWNTQRTEINREINPELFSGSAIACPDPHIERWFLADPISLGERFGQTPQLPKRKCGRSVYKRLLHDWLVGAGEVVTLGGAEFATDIVNVMDLYRACRDDAALKSFVDSVRSYLKLRHFPSS